MSEKSILGHGKIIEFLNKAIKQGTLSHAYLFVGMDSVGKTTVAEWFIETLINNNVGNGLKPLSTTHPDVFILERLVDEKGKEKNVITVEQVRELRHQLSLSSFLGGYKIAFLKEAAYLNTQSSNALLKILEEPPEKTIFILRARNTKELPATIVSRCQVLRFSLVSQSLIEQALEKEGIESKEAHLISRLCQGMVGIAFSFIENKNAWQDYQESFFQFIDLLKSAPYKRFSLLLQKLPKDELNQKAQALEILDQWESFLRDIILTRVGVSELQRNDFSGTGIETSISSFPVVIWKQALDCLRYVRQMISQNANPLLGLERIVLSLPVIKI